MKARPKKLTFTPAAPARRRRLNQRLLAALRAEPKLPWCARVTQDMLRAPSPLGSHLRQWGVPSSAGPQHAGSTPPFDGDLYAHLRRPRQRPPWLVVDDVLDNPARLPAGIERWLADSGHLRDVPPPQLVPLGPITVRVVGPGGKSEAYLVNSLASTGPQLFRGRGQLHYPTPAEEAAEMARLDAMTQEQINAEFGLSDEELARLQEGL